MSLLSLHLLYRLYDVVPPCTLVGHAYCLHNTISVSVSPEAEADRIGSSSAFLAQVPIIDDSTGLVLALALAFQPRNSEAVAQPHLTAFLL